MQHIDSISNRLGNKSQELIKRATGKFYTGKVVGQQLTEAVVEAIAEGNLDPTKPLKVVDPFGGDGRLIVWLLHAWKRSCLPDLDWNISVWDIDAGALAKAKERIESALSGFSHYSVNIKVVDSFIQASSDQEHFDLAITNPPWELLKPDSRELEHLPVPARTAYQAKLRQYDNWLIDQYPISQPFRKFAGWGTNLSRVGLEASLRLVARHGLVAIVLPASFLADTQSVTLRKHVILDNAIRHVTYFPAEAKAYELADVASVTLLLEKGADTPKKISFSSYLSGRPYDEVEVRLEKNLLSELDYVLPVSFGARAVEVLTRLQSSLPKWASLEKSGVLWAGRELDETGSNEWLAEAGEGPPFVRGRMIGRYEIRERPFKRVERENLYRIVSMRFPRMAWRDVSRSNQKRRMIATLIPAGWVAGNSLGIAYFKDGNVKLLRSFLAIANSTVFEFQLRAFLATGHVSLSSLRKVAIPSLHVLQCDTFLPLAVSKALSGDEKVHSRIDAYVAKLYGLDEAEYHTIISLFPKISGTEKAEMLSGFAALDKQPGTQSVAS